MWVAGEWRVIQKNKDGLRPNTSEQWDDIIFWTSQERVKMESVYKSVIVLRYHLIMWIDQSQILSSFMSNALDRRNTKYRESSNSTVFGTKKKPY